MMETTDTSSAEETPKVSRKEVLAWASYDIANSTYATVVATAVYNSYFVKYVVPGHANNHGYGTAMLAVVIAIASAMIVLTAPFFGTIADATASKKRFLLASTGLCIVATALLSAVPPGDYVIAMVLLVIANFAFGTGEDFIASFLPEISPRETMGRISAIGWGAGYIGGLFSLGAALSYVHWSLNHHVPPQEFVPRIMLACAAVFAALCAPTVFLLKERAVPEARMKTREYIDLAMNRLQVTFSHTLYYRDLFNILIAICVYSCGTGTVVHLASVYAQETLKFTQAELLVMILVVDFTAAVGAFIFGWVQDRIGSVRTLTITLIIWTVAIIVAFLAREKWHLWISGNIIGLAMGASGSAGRALVGRFSPAGRSGEFLGLWGLAMKLATCVGVIVFGSVTVLTGGDLRLAMAGMVVFFLAGIVLVQRVDEKRGIEAAQHPVPGT